MDDVGNSTVCGMDVLGAVVNVIPKERRPLTGEDLAVPGPSFFLGTVLLFFSPVLRLGSLLGYHTAQERLPLGSLALSNTPCSLISWSHGLPAGSTDTCLSIHFLTSSPPELYTHILTAARPYFLWLFVHTCARCWGCNEEHNRWDSCSPDVMGE